MSSIQSLLQHRTVSSTFPPASSSFLAKPKKPIDVHGGGLKAPNHANSIPVLNVNEASPPPFTERSLDSYLIIERS